ncbi:TYR-PHOSPHATASE-2 domain-containing protein [Mycena indigotica]|uniref:TYR-PHOSPHATASE-2 domain-containing protein n=1 Tax=Mycena indigotica TaxID=2126181 RepID=A0A8H6TD69_9AGAR|nr:TYR-PHOSPHATASE-2 domain-containing protein [Mycena indigotica]KAF7315315.1 TYR-PHOSPHATASE-2 domain-containing protein [Mycena indigotica]
MAAMLASLASQHPQSAYNRLKFGPGGSPLIYGPLPAEQLVLLEQRRAAAVDTWWPCEAIQENKRLLGPCGSLADESLREQLAAALKDELSVPPPQLKTSATHPLSVSTIIPCDYIPFISRQLAYSSHPRAATVFDLEPAFTLDHLLIQQRLDSNNLPPPPPPPPPPQMLVTRLSSSSSSLCDALHAALTTSVDSPICTNAALSVTLTMPLDTKTSPSVPDAIGNLFLSSCPGKKGSVMVFPSFGCLSSLCLVRLHGPVKGRSGVCRDLNADLGRIKQLGVAAVICCLDHAELEFLGAPWHLYEPAAKAVGISILHIPIPEGLAPASPASLDAHLTRIIDTFTLQGKNVLVHCRGGVGRAGVVACCWMLKLGLLGWLNESLPATTGNADGLRPGTVELVERVIRIVRQRRSIKAVETYEQVKFLVDYVDYLDAKRT